jgi:MerR family transcriptional regulator, light-induced transcriptional regulator
MYGFCQGFEQNILTNKVFISNIGVLKQGKCMNIPVPIATDEAIFNIGAVARITGIPITSLHAWERRYGFPHSSVRTLGGHRLYSEGDVTLLRCVKAQIEQGITVRQAVLLVQKMDHEGRLPPGHPVAASRPLEQLPKSTAGHLQLAEALFRRDLARADQLIGEMLAFFSPEEITLNIIGPALADLGQAWEDGHITAADEHLASNYLRQRLLMWMVTGPTARPVKPIVLACAPGEYHEGSLLMLGVLLRRQGWPVAYLGQNVPLADLAAFVEQVLPEAVVLLGMLNETASNLADWQKWIRQTNGKPLIAIAGRAFVIRPELKELVPGIYLGDTVQSGLLRLEELLE